MSRIPRLLPLVAIAIGGVLAVKALTEAPQIYLASRALAEDVVSPKASTKPPLPPGASILVSNNGQSSIATAKPAAPACAPTAAELAKEAGLSPAELQVLQSLGDRRGQLDQREESMDTQVQLIAAAEAKLDARIQEMTGLKTDIQGLLGQADQQQQAEADRLVRVYEDMPEKKAAASMSVLDDSVRLPIAAKMKERKLAAILAAMAPQDAKTLTEKLAERMAGSKVLADAKTALNPPAAPAPAPAPTPTPPTAKAKAKANPAAPAPDQNAQVGQTGPAVADAATPKPSAKPQAKPHKVARAKPHPTAKPADADVADAMHPPGGAGLAVAKTAIKPAPKPPAKVASANAAPTSTLKPAPPLPPSAKPG